MREIAVDEFGRVTSISETAGGFTRRLVHRSYDGHGQIVREFDARDRTVTYQYDGAGRLLSSTIWADSTQSTALDSVTFGNHDALGRPRMATYADGSVENLGFDARGRLLQRTLTTASTSETWTYEYDGAGRITRQTHPDGSWVRYEFDAAGLRTRSVNHRGERVDWIRDAAGHVQEERMHAANDALLYRRTVLRDDVHRVQREQDSRGFVVDYGYSATGLLNSITDPLGLSRTVEHDALARPRRLHQPNTTAMRNLGGPATVSTTLGYRPGTDVLASVTDTGSVQTLFDQDALLRPTAERSANTGVTQLTPDVLGATISKADARGIRIDRTLDAQGRVSRLAPSVSAPITYTYSDGRPESPLASMRDSSGTTTWQRDAAGRVTSMTHDIGVLRRVVGVQRDTLGRPSVITYPSGRRIGLEYDGDQVRRVTVDGQVLMSDISYRPFGGPPTGWRWGNGTQHQREYDQDGRVTRITLGSRPRTYAYDAAGRIERWTDANVPAGQVPASTFSYDEAGQLRSYSGPQGTRSYSWDANGNRRSETVNGVTRSYAYDPGTNRLRTVSGRRSYTYNADGSPASDSATGWTYSYDGFGRLVMAARSDRRVSFVYNGLGQRVQKTVEYFVPDTGGVEPWRQVPRRPASSVVGVVPRDATVRSRQAAAGSAQVAQNGYWNLTNAFHYVFDEAGQLLGQYDLIGSYQQETVWLGNLPVALMRGQGLEYIHPDHLGTPRVITRVSDNAERWRWDSDPFGTTLPITTSHPTSPPLRFDLRFPGQIYDSETGLHYNGMRDYDPWTGRYIQSDPVGIVGGINTYAYADGNPVAMIDPYGLWAYAPEYRTSGRGLTPSILSIETVVDQTFQLIAGRDALVTYTTNGEHKADSLHYSGNAVDLRTRDLTRTDAALVARLLREALGSRFDVIDEGSHIHIEFDPKCPR